MKKPKSKEKQRKDEKRGRKRSLRFKKSREKVAKNKQLVIDERVKEKLQFKEWLRKVEEARAIRGF